MRKRMTMLLLTALVVAMAAGAIELGNLPDSATATGAANISAGGFHTCSLATMGEVDCWGSNAFERLGNGTTVDESTPVRVGRLFDNATAISAGFFHSCALTPAGDVLCWGNNTLGQLGDGTTIDRSLATNVCADSTCVSFLGEISAIAVGSSHSCAVTVTGSVKCWGANGGGQLGNGTINHMYPIDVCSDQACTSSLSNVSAIATGGTHTCGLTTTGGVLCWGGNNNGQLGDGRPRTDPTQ